MKKNSAKILADLVLNKGSNAFKDLRARSVDENQFQSDAAASRLRSEIAADLKDLLSGKNWDAISEKIQLHATAPSVLRIRPIGDRRARPETLNITTKRIRLGANEVNLVTVRPDEQSPEQWVYGLLADALETGDIQRLMLCQICGKIFYRKSLKGTFCRNDCRWQHFNSYEERQARYKRAVEKKQGRPTRITPRGPRQKRIR
jgi:hypothetical protein